MRVRSLMSGTRHSREDGAVAIIVAIMMVLLVGMGAFAVDFGAAYATKRQLSTAADAAALAAAEYYASQVGQTCSALSDSSTLFTAAQTSADAAFTANMTGPYFASEAPPPTGVLSSPVCSPQGSLFVTFGDGATTKTVLAGVFGVKQITTSRQATSEISVPNIGTGLRPAALCLSKHSAGAVVNGPPYSVAPVYFPDPVCGTPPGHAPGNWYLLRCPGQGSGSDALLGNYLLNGCPEPVQIINTDLDADSDGNQITGSGDSDTIDDTAATIIPTLAAGCVTSGNPAECLVASTGNKFDSGIDGCPPATPSGGYTAAEALYCLTQNATTVLFPVFYPGSVLGTGTNAHYPIYGLLSATICGFHTTSGKGAVNSSSSKCSGAEAPASPTTPDYLLLKFSTYQSFGRSGGGTCAIGANCDGGNRQVSLVR